MDENQEAPMIHLPAKIGPTFVSELVSAGVLGTVNVGWDPVAGRVDVAADCPADLLARIKAVIAAHDPTKTLAASPPDCLSLPWWRTALKIWFRTDPATSAPVSRYQDVDAAIRALETAVNADSSPNVHLQRVGLMAREQLEYANSATLAQLQQIAPAFGFTQADCVESLWRADRVAQGDYSGIWPLPSGA